MPKRLGSLTIVLACIQIANGEREAAGLCREEYQAFLKHFAAPLIKQKIRERCVSRGDEEIDHDTGRTFKQVYDEWQGNLKSAYDCCTEYGLCAKRAKNEGLWSAHKNVPRSAYEPSDVPFFLTIDNATCHSLWLDHEKVHLSSPGVSLLQLLRVPPFGHDLHQIIEHSIGVTKRHVRASVKKKRGSDLVGQDVQACELLAWAEEGAARFTAESWAKNLDRLHICLQLVAAEKHTVIVFWYHNRERRLPGTGGNYCYLAFS
jgi:hypothetical protein